MSSIASHQGIRPAYPLMERAGVAATLAIAAGLLNSWTLVHTHSFATVQSGNIVSAGVYAATGDGGGLLQALISIFAFAAGAFLCAIAVNFADRAKRAYSSWILAAEAIILLGVVVFVLSPWSTAMAVSAILSFVAGVQGNAFHRDSGMLYGNVAVTFVLQGAAGYLGRAASRSVYNDGERHVRPAAIYGAVLLGFGAGGAIGVAFGQLWGPAPILVTAIVLGVLGMIAGRGAAVDPAQNAPTP